MTRPNQWLSQRMEMLEEALENDILFFDSIANHEHFEATGIGNLCRGYAARRRDLLAKLEGDDHELRGDAQ